MKKVLSLLILVLFLCSCSATPNNNETQYCESGIWISYYEINSMLKSEKGFKSEFENVIENCKKLQIQNLYIHVRAFCDSLFNSDYYPLMQRAEKYDYDIFEFVIDECHKENIKVHAWINPYRVSTATTNIDEITASSPAYKWLKDDNTDNDRNVSFANGIYLNPSEQSVQGLVIDGIREIIVKYDVDGIHFDDYFYPYPIYETDENSNRVAAAFADDDAYNTYGAGFDDIGDWRRDNVNKLVELSYKTVKKADKKCLFGVSPFGIWKNGYGGETGSVTRGSQSYFEIYCDTLAWAKGEYVDYVAPQLYWTDDNDAASYRVLTEWWSEALEGTGTALLVSHAAYRYDEWESPSGIMKSQVENASGYENYRGSIFYGYEEIANNKEGITDELKKIYAD